MYHWSFTPNYSTIIIYMSYDSILYDNISYLIQNLIAFLFLIDDYIYYDKTSVKVHYFSVVVKVTELFYDIDILLLCE